MAVQPDFGGRIFGIKHVGKPPRCVRLEKSPALGWTEPAGRCDRDPARTIDHEVNEELLVLFQRVGRKACSPVAIAGAVYEDRPADYFKERQVRERGTAIRRAAIAQDIVASRFSTDVDGNLAFYQQLPHDAGLYRSISVTCDGVQRARFPAMAFMIPELDTLEIRKIVIFPIAAGDKVVCLDGETYGRQTAMLSLASLLDRFGRGDLKTRPGLRAYLTALQTSIPAPCLVS